MNKSPLHTSLVVAERLTGSEYPEPQTVHRNQAQRFPDRINTVQRDLVVAACERAVPINPEWLVGRFQNAQSRR